MKNKQYYFLQGLPRSGNTLLSSLINQNPNVCLTANSILVDILWQLSIIKDSSSYKNFPDSTSFENVTKNIFKNYYAKYDANKIIDRGFWGAPANLNEIKENITKKPKFIVLYRPIVECLASFVKLGEPRRDQELLDFYLPNDQYLGMAYMSIKNILVQKEDYVFVTYKELTEQPINTVKKIFKFIEEDYIPIRTTGLKQININNTVYDDSILTFPFHKIKTDAIRNEDIKVKDYLSEKVIKEVLEFDDILEYL
tara:strand:- start:275 stop:1036 length:762 start_codon:yes stop_codon:yes gene_type:complete